MFIPIIRTVAPFVAGASNMRYPRYIVFCITGACLWVGGLITLGYQFGNLELVKKNFELVVLGIITISFLPVAHQAWQSIRAKNQ
jgi:membrane-associated protein